MHAVPSLHIFLFLLVYALSLKRQILGYRKLKNVTVLHFLFIEINVDDLWRYFISLKDEGVKMEQYTINLGSLNFKSHTLKINLF